jgi:hypothetical protein
VLKRGGFVRRSGVRFRISGLQTPQFRTFESAFVGVGSTFRFPG